MKKSTKTLIAAVTAAAVAGSTVVLLNSGSKSKLRKSLRKSYRIDKLNIVKEKLENHKARVEKHLARINEKLAEQETNTSKI